MPLTATVDEADHGLPCAAKITIDLPPDPARDPQRGPSADQQRDMEAAAVAQLCRRLVGSIEVARQDGTRTLLKPGDIALLAPTRTDLWRYERALEAEGLSVASQAGKTLLRRQETQDVLALLRTLADPFDTLAFGAFMRGPLVGLTEEQLFDITEALQSSGEEGGHPRTFTVLTSLTDVPNPLAKSILGSLQELRQRSPVTTPMILLSEAAERLHVRVLLAARYGNRNARALANLDALIEMARPYGVSGLRTFVRDLQGDWERKTPRSEGRIDASEDAIEIVTIHSSKGLEWPVVIPINTATLLRSPSQFVHRQSDNTLHWVLGHVAPPELAEARTEEGLNEARERERRWYVACTRARDILLIPRLPSASRLSWSQVLDLGHSRLPEFDLAALPDRGDTSVPLAENFQTRERFALEAEAVSRSSPALNWRSPSDHDPDRALTFETAPNAIDGNFQRVELVGAGHLRGVLLHKLMEELLTGELREDDLQVEVRASFLLDQLAGMELPSEVARPNPIEMATTALRTLRFPEIAALRPLLLAEATVWSGSDEEGFLAGRADAVAVDNGRVIAVLDWKSDVAPTANDRAGYVGQLAEYLAATGAPRGALVYMSLGETVWVTNGQ